MQVESDVIRRLRAGDESAFETVYHKLNTAVYQLAFRFLKDKIQSEEIVQETFLSLWLHREKLNDEGNLWLYVYVISKRLSLNALRNIHKSAELYEKLLLNIKESHNETEEEILAADLEKFTDNLLLLLPKQQQVIFKLSRIDGLSHKEIADKLEISPNTVKNHIVQSLKTLRSQIHQADLAYFIPLFFFFTNRN